MSHAGTATAPQSDAELEELLSRPSEGLAASLAQVPGDLMVLGAGGKMGPSLARMTKRADRSRRVIAVSRWTNASSSRALADEGIEIVHADLRDLQALSRLPDVPNIIFMAGQKFGMTNSPSTTWAMNAGVPAFVAERFAGARIVVFSTGNVYALSPVQSSGARETDAPAPIGEYAYSCLARERLFTAAAVRHGTLLSVVRLNYAHALRYGVLTDLAVRILAGKTIDRSMGYVNVIWQADASALALASLVRASAPEPYVVNVAGRETLRVADLAERLSRVLGVSPRFKGSEASDALLSDSSRMTELLPGPLLPVDTLLQWVGEWVKCGRPLLDKPTAFERRDGRF